MVCHLYIRLYFFCPSLYIEWGAKRVLIRKVLISLYYFIKAPGDSSAHLVPGEVTTQTNEMRIDPKISPSDSNVIAFIHHNDLRVTNISSNKKQLTWSNSGVLNVVDEALLAGVPSFVVQEEFDRSTGYWWQPRTESDDYSKANKYCILYEEVCLRLWHTL